MPAKKKTEEFPKIETDGDSLAVLDPGDVVKFWNFDGSTIECKVECVDYDGDVGIAGDCWPCIEHGTVEYVQIIKKADPATTFETESGDLRLSFQVGRMSVNGHEVSNDLIWALAYVLGVVGVAAGESQAGYSAAWDHRIALTPTSFECGCVESSLEELKAALSWAFEQLDWGEIDWS